MAERTPILTDVAQIAEAAGNDGVSGATRHTYSNIGDARRKKQRARRIEALSLKLAGVSTAQIAERMGIAPDSVRKLIDRTLRTAENRAAEEMRELENARLDRAQAAILSQVLAGDYRAVMAFLAGRRTAHPGTAVVAPQAGFSVPRLGREPFPHRGANVGTLCSRIRYSSTPAYRARQASSLA